jgi:trehalose utilization protein
MPKLVFCSLLALLALTAVAPSAQSLSRRKFRVVVWDERQPAQKTIYPNFLGNHIADYLRQQANSKAGREPDFTVESVALDDPGQGLSDEVLDRCDVLIYWGHVRHHEVSIERAKEVAKRVKEGRLSLLALHSAHWSQPFMETMNLRAIDDALKTLSRSERQKATVQTIVPEKRIPSPTEPMTPSFQKQVGAEGAVTLIVKLPMCVFPYVRGDGKPSHVRTLLPKHPIAKGIPEAFDIPHTEMYGDPFHVPTPDATLFEEKWDAGESFRSGSIWKVGKGNVFYFRPGHETFDVYKQPIVLKIVENAVRWLGSQAR